MEFGTKSAELDVGGFLSWMLRPLSVVLSMVDRFFGRFQFLVLVVMIGQVKQDAFVQDPDRPQLKKLQHCILYKPSFK